MAIMCVLPNKAQPKMNNKNAAMITLTFACQEVTKDMFKLKNEGTWVGSQLQSTRLNFFEVFSLDNCIFTNRAITRFATAQRATKDERRSERFSAAPGREMEPIITGARRTEKRQKH